MKTIGLFCFILISCLPSFGWGEDFRSAQVLYFPVGTTPCLGTASRIGSSESFDVRPVMTSDCYPGRPLHRSEFQLMRLIDEGKIVTLKGKDIINHRAQAVIYLGHKGTPPISCIGTMAGVFTSIDKPSDSYGVVYRQGTASCGYGWALIDLNHVQSVQLVESASIRGRLVPVRSRVVIQESALFGLSRSQCNGTLSQITETGFAIVHGCNDDDLIPLTQIVSATPMQIYSAEKK